RLGRSPPASTRRRRPRLHLGTRAVPHHSRRSLCAHRSHEASSMIQRTSALKPIPRYAACSGTSDVAVMPGWVLTSSTMIRFCPFLPVRGVVAEIGAGDSAAAERLMRALGQAHGFLGHCRTELRRNDVLGPA